MSAAFLIQTLFSLLALAGLVGLAAWLGSPREGEDLTEARARALFAAEFPDVCVDAVWLSPDLKGALGRAGDEVLIVYRAGDGFVLRSAPWTAISTAVVKDDHVLLRLDDLAAPRAALSVINGAAWPPLELKTDRLTA